MRCMAQELMLPDSAVPQDWTVPQSWFGHFYAIGACWNVLVSALFLCSYFPTLTPWAQVGARSRAGSAASHASTAHPPAARTSLDREPQAAQPSPATLARLSRRGAPPPTHAGHVPRCAGAAAAAPGAAVPGDGATVAVPTRGAHAWHRLPLWPQVRPALPCTAPLLWGRLMWPCFGSISQRFPSPCLQLLPGGPHHCTARCCLWAHVLGAEAPRCPAGPAGCGPSAAAAAPTGRQPDCAAVGGAWPGVAPVLRLRKF